jgi:hypothetical protein
VSATAAPTVGRPATDSVLVRAERAGWLLFAALAALATALLFWAGRDTAYSPDELAWFMHSPDLGLDGALQPHAGHLILSTRIVYKLVFEAVGVDYFWFRLLTAATVVLSAALFFAYVSRRIGRVAALAPTAVLLVFGSDATHMVLGNGFTVVGAVACGVGALLALDREDRTGDVLACGLLCLGVATYTVALAFVAGIAVSVLLRGDRWRRIWIVAIPVALYAAWWLWALHLDASSEGQLAPSDIVLFPSWAFQSLAAVLSAVTGLDYEFTANAGNAAGVVFALALLAALGWRLSRGSVPTMLWALIGAALALWLMGSLARTSLRQPDSSRYLYPGAVTVLLVCAWAAVGTRLSRRALVAIFAIAAIGVATNIALLRDGTDLFRAVAVQTRAELGAIALADGSADPGYVPTGGSPTVALGFTSVAEDDLQPTAAYLTASERYGSLGDTPAEIRGGDEATRARADEVLAGATGLALAPTAEQQPGEGCIDLVPGADLSLEPGETALLFGQDQAASISVRRFASATSTSIGTLAPDSGAVLAPPADSITDPWHVSADAPALACSP